MRSWSPWRAARVAASGFVLMVAAYYLMVAFDNLTNPMNPNASNWPMVQGVLSGDGVPADSGFGWHFIDATPVQVLAYLAIVAAEAIAGIALLIGGSRGLQLSRTHDRWAGAQRWTYLGGTVGLGLFFLGFMVIGGNWFIMYLNAKWNALQPAFQNSAMTALMLVLVTGVLAGGQLAAEPQDPG